MLTLLLLHAASGTASAATSGVPPQREFVSTPPVIRSEESEVSSHWANPGNNGSGCSSGDTPVRFPDASHECCLPKCTGMTCPPAPAGTHGVAPVCWPVSIAGQPPYTYCSLNCLRAKSCPTNASCVNIGGAGVCTYNSSRLQAAEPSAAATAAAEATGHRVLL